MAVLQEYKCPCCGGAIAFDSTLQKMKCPYCDTLLWVLHFVLRAKSRAAPRQMAEGVKTGLSERSTQPVKIGCGKPSAMTAQIIMVFFHDLPRT